MGGVVLPGEKPGKVNYKHPAALLNMLKKAEMLNRSGLIITLFAVILSYLNLSLSPESKSHWLTVNGSWLIGCAMLVTAFLMLQVYSLLKDVAHAVRFLYRTEDLSLVMAYPWYLTRQMSGEGLQKIEFAVMKLIYIFYPLAFAFVFMWMPDWWRLWHAPVSAWLVLQTLAVFSVSRGFQKPLVTWNPEQLKMMDVDCEQSLSTLEQ